MEEVPRDILLLEVEEGGEDGGNSLCDGRDPMLASESYPPRLAYADGMAIGEGRGGEGLLSYG